MQWIFGHNHYWPVPSKMSGADTSLLDEILGVANTLPQEEQLQYVRLACGADHQLYDCAIARLFGISPQWHDLEVAEDVEHADHQRTNSPGEIIGPYRILHSLGHGGMGEVFLAERADQQFHQRVAIKLVKRGMVSRDIQARLRMERQILASLEHPNIARLLDGGTTVDGTPYIVMEYVDGRPIDIYCDELALTIDQRLQLFRSICSAVHSAHQNLIVHRDLKPSNILVAANGVPKLLDFGIAKMLDTRQLNQTMAVTHADVRMMTPDHASPEQLRGDLITTASDTYVLGVLLYELLTGFKPFVLKGNSLAELERAICEELPIAPHQVFSVRSSMSETEMEDIARHRGSSVGRLRRELQGDLSNIILMALRKEPDRRYSSVQQFSDDIDRYLQGMPVRARTDTWNYRTGKFIKRHAFVVALSTLFLAMLVGFTINTYLVSKERDQERQAAQSFSAFLLELFGTSDPAQARGKERSAGEILEMAAEKIPAELAGQPRQQAIFLNKIGNVFLRRGELDKAQQALERALDILQRQLDLENQETVDALLDLGGVHIEQGNLPKAEALIKQSMAISARIEGRDSKGAARGECGLGILEMRRDQLDAAVGLLQRCLRIYESLSETSIEELSPPLNYLAVIRRTRGDFEGAAALYSRLLELNSKQGADHPEYIRALGNLATLRQAQNKLEEAERLYRQVLPLDQRLYGKVSMRSAQILTNLGTLLQRKQDLTGADNAYQESLAIYDQLDAPAEYRAYVLGRMGGLALDAGDPVKAESLYRRALEMYQNTPDAKSGFEATALMGLAKTLLRTQRAVEAETTIRAALILWSGKGTFEPGLSLAILGRSLHQQGKRSEAQQLLKDGYQNFLAKGGANSPDAPLLRAWLDEAKATVISRQPSK